MSSADKLNVQHIRKTLEAHHKNVVEHFHKKHSHVLTFAKKHSMVLAGTAFIVSTALGTGHAYAKEHEKNRQRLEKSDQSIKNSLGMLNASLAEKQTLSREEEYTVAEVLSKNFDLPLTPQLDGNRLNEIYGYVGAEQHLRRWSGDTLAQHNLQRSGMAPNQGAFRDFDNAEQEKYYVAVQLHELPNWNSEWSTLKPWYRYRKVFVYNPANQRGIVAVIGDAGPSKFTGKTFGGSPEIMEYLNMKDGGQKGKAIILFVDDPENKIALGPSQ